MTLDCMNKIGLDRVKVAESAPLSPHMESDSCMLSAAQGTWGRWETRRRGCSRWEREEHPCAEWG